MYNPSEDSFLLSETLKSYLKDKVNNKNKSIKILDMGSGRGIQAETCLNLGFKNIICADVDEEAVKFLKQKNFRAIKSNLFSKIKGKFNLIIFNPPYLPEDKYDKEKDTSGGKKGYETILKFLEQTKFHLEKNGEILLLFSSLSQPKIIINKAEEIGYKLKFLASKKLFFEELYVYSLT